MVLDDILAELDEPLSDNFQAKEEAAEERKSKLKMAQQSDLNKFVSKKSSGMISAL